MGEGGSGLTKPPTAQIALDTAVAYLLNSRDFGIARGNSAASEQEISNMRKTSLIYVLVIGGLLAASGCARQPAEDPRVKELEAENAALRAQLLDLQRKQAAPAPAPKPAVDPRRRAALERYGVKVHEGAGAVTLTLPGKVLFASGSAALRSSARRALDQSATVIKTDFRNALVIVEGHTDNQPIRRTKHLWKTNQQLSVARAKSVAAHLRKAGVNPANITIRGHGASKPVATNKTKKGRALNRRVELVIRVTP
jgi:chemotaxis protein MotB